MNLSIKQQMLLLRNANMDSKKQKSKEEVATLLGIDVNKIEILDDDVSNDFHHWNYRMFRTKKGYFKIVEVHYDINNVPTSRTKKATSLHGESYKDIKDDISLINMALSKPALEAKDFKYYGKSKKRNKNEQ